MHETVTPRKSVGLWGTKDGLFVCLYQILFNKLPCCEWTCPILQVRGIYENRISYFIFDLAENEYWMASIYPRVQQFKLVTTIPSTYLPYLISTGSTVSELWLAAMKSQNYLAVIVLIRTLTSARFIWISTDWRVHMLHQGTKTERNGSVDPNPNLKVWASIQDLTHGL